VRTWWEACTFGGFDRLRFDLVGARNGEPLASATIWAIEPLGTSWGVHAAGIIDLRVDPAHRQQGYATALVGELMKQLQQYRFAVIVAQVHQQDPGFGPLFLKLGFQHVDSGRVFRKT